MGYEVIKFIWQSQQVALAGCGFFAWKGATWIGITLDKIIDKFVDSKLRRSDDGFDFDNQENKEYK
nr:MAG TPA: holin [Caudoviricetes sp.]